MGPIWNTKGRNELMDLSEIVTACQNKSTGETRRGDALVCARCIASTMSATLRRPPALSAKLLANVEAHRLLGWTGELSREHFFTRPTERHDFSVIFIKAAQPGRDRSSYLYDAPHT